MIPRLIVAAILLLQAARPPEPTRSLTAAIPIHDFLAGGGRAVFSVDVPANTAARIVLEQQGVDVGLTLRRQGSALPEHGLDLTAGIDGEEVSYPAIGDADATWIVTVSTAVPRAARGEYTISLGLQPADDRNRAIAIARAKYHAASDTAWGGDAKAFQQAVVEYADSADAAEAAGDKALAAEAIYQWARIRDNLGDAPGCDRAAAPGARRCSAAWDVGIARRGCSTGSAICRARSGRSRRRNPISGRRCRSRATRTIR